MTEIVQFFFAWCIIQESIENCLLEILKALWEHYKFIFQSSDSCPVLCGGNGEYEKGHCVCRNGWKGPECDVPEEQCIDPTCFGHGTCIMGVCICVPGYKGEICEEGQSPIFIYCFRLFSHWIAQGTIPCF